VNGLRLFATFALLQCGYFVLLVVNIRAVAHAQYAAAVVTDGLICLCGWTLLKKIVAADGVASRCGYITGGMAGSALGIWLTRVWG
jgi:hypothetical protein